MRTYYDITLSIDDEKYAVRIRDLTKEENISYKKQMKKFEDENLEYARLTDEFNELSEDIALNQKIIENTEDEDVDIELLKEQKRLLKKLREVAPKLKAKDKDALVEEMNSKLFETLKLRLSKSGAKGYLAQIKEKNLDMMAVMMDVSKTIAKAREKK